jgi:FkbM family methyltransferase
MLNKFLNRIKKIFLYCKLKFLINHRPIQKDSVEYLGSSYGGWYLKRDKKLYSSTIISAGLGEDASFDVEFLNKYNAKVFLVDPTPKAIVHYKSILLNKGKKRIKRYKKNSGKQDPNSYNLKKVSNNNFILIEKALFNNNNKLVRFYPPYNPDHVSCSLKNNSNLKNSTLVKTITVKNIMQSYNIKKISLIKLDIEGAEIEVIKNFINDKIFPGQILVEFDELRNLSKNSIEKFIKIYRLLNKNNYYSYRVNNFPCFLFIKK